MGSLESKAMAFQGTRSCVRAGSWYEGNPTKLAQQLTKLIEQHGSTLPSPVLEADVRGVIGPHAGLSYCANTSAAAYAAMRQWLARPSRTNPTVSNGSQLRQIYLIGPSHQKYIDGIEVTSASSYATPFGNFSVDADALKDVAAACSAAKVKCGQLSMEDDEGEHSLELHLPFLGLLCLLPPSPAAGPMAPNAKIVPILVGDMSAAEEAAFGEGVLRPLLGDPRNFFVISSDFCHWGSRFRYTFQYPLPVPGSIGECIEAMDREAIQHIEKNDSVGWNGYLRRTANTICGRHAIGSLLSGLSSHRVDGAKTFFLHYSQSSRCTALSDSSVSYASAAIVFPGKS